MGEKEGQGETQASGPRPGRQAASPRAPRISALRPALGAGPRRRPFPLLAEVSTSLLPADLPATRACPPQQAQRPTSARRGGSELTGQAGPRRREAFGARGGAANLACPPGAARPDAVSVAHKVLRGYGCRRVGSDLRGSGLRDRNPRLGPREHRGSAEAAGSVLPQPPAARVRPRPSSALPPLRAHLPFACTRAPADVRSGGSDLPCERGVFLGPPRSPTGEHA